MMRAVDEQGSDLHAWSESPPMSSSGGSICLPLPKVVNLLTDLKEERDAGAKASWVAYPMTKILTDFQESLAKSSPIKMGTPDPYVPPK